MPSMLKLWLVPALVITVLSTLIVWQICQLVEAHNWVDHTDLVITEALKLERTAIDLQTSARAYALTGIPANLKMFYQAEEDLPEIERDLRRLVADNPAQLARIENLHDKNLKPLSEFLDELVQPRHSAKTKLQLVRSGAAEGLINGLRDDVSAFTQQERTYRIERIDHARAWSTTAFLTAMAVGLLCLVWFTWVVRGNQKTTQRVAESERRFRSVVESAADLILLLDSRGTIRFAGPQSFPLLGWEPKELIGAPIERLIPLQLNTQDSGFHRPLMMAKRKDLHEVAVDVSLSPAPLESGETGYTAILRDVSRRYREEMRYAIAHGLTLELAGVPDVETAARTISTRFGEAFHARYTLFAGPGAPAASPLRARLEEAFAGTLAKLAAWREPFLIPVPESLTDLQVVSVFAIPLHPAETYSAIVILLSTQSLYGPEDIEFARMLGQRAALGLANAYLTGELKKAVQAREDTLAVVSHDLRNPLGAAKMSLDLLNEALSFEPFDLKQAKDLIQTGLRSVRFATTLVNDLLDLAKIEAGRFSVEPELNTLASIFDNVQLMSRAHAEQKRITVAVEPRYSGAIVCDRLRLEQLLGNLVSNAIKFSAPGSRVRLTSEAVGSEVRIAVEDNGPGMTDEVARHIFDRYWQPRATRRNGYGLGLFIAKGIAEAHGGRLEVESVLGSGSRFILKLPRLREGGTPQLTVAKVQRSGPP